MSTRRVDIIIQVINVIKLIESQDHSHFSRCQDANKNFTSKYTHRFIKFVQFFDGII